jgi:hypothetical protein
MRASYIAELDRGIDYETVLSRSRQTNAAAFNKHAEEFSTGFAVLSKRALRLRKPLR